MSFGDDFHAELFPWQSIGAAGGDDLDLMAVDHDDVVLFKLRGGLLRGNLAGELALRGIVFEEVGEVVGRDDVADGGDFECGAEVALFDECAEDEASDASESVDGDGSHMFSW